MLPFNALTQDKVTPLFLVSFPSLPLISLAKATLLLLWFFLSFPLFLYFPEIKQQLLTLEQTCLQCTFCCYVSSQEDLHMNLHSFVEST